MADFLSFLQRRIIGIYWLILTVHCIFLVLHLPYMAATKPLLVPLLLTFLLGKDNNIGKTAGKFIFYVGLFLALFGDVLFIYGSDTFFLSGMIIFMIMNLCYAFSFFQLTGFRIENGLLLAVVAFLLFLIGYQFYEFMKYDLGQFAVAIIVYMFTVSAMVLAAVNAAADKRFSHVGAKYFVPGAVIFLMENIILAVNSFHYKDHHDIYLSISTIIAYATAQYFFVKGIEKAYL